MTLNVLVVDDEALARERVIRMLDHLDGIEVVGEAQGGAEALKKAAAMEPDVLLLDIDMPDLTGLEVAAQLDDRVAVIFATAYDAFAIQAFEAEAVDYLVKPISQNRLVTAIQRAQKRADFDGLHRHPTGSGTATYRVVASQNGRIEIFDARSITRFWAQDKYTWFISDGREQLTEERLDSLEARLGDLGFFRLHRSELVRLDAIRSLDKEAAGLTVGTVDGQTASVSRRKVSALKELLGI